MTGFEGLNIAPDLDIPQQFRTNNNVPPWDPMKVKNNESSYLPANHLPPPSQPQPSPASSNSYNSRPQSLELKVESGKIPSPIRRIKGSGNVEKKKTETKRKFVIMTPDLLSAPAGKPNMFECFDAMRQTSRGRKGPLADDTKENALLVRRKGACFCCHSRKVKCDKERPCKNCRKLTAQVPQIICWQFQDFLPALFPDFIRGHFKKDQMAKFFSDNIKGFTVGGMEKACQVELFSGTRFQSTLTLRANFFTAKGLDATRHWHMNVGVNQLDLQYRGSVPIGIDMEKSSHKDELRRKTREYIQNITFDPQYAEQVTDSFRHTELPRKILSIVQKFGCRSDSAMVKRALSIYAMNYVLTRHLCFTNSSIQDLQQTSPLAQNIPWVTPRVLNRQIKSVLDEMLRKEMQSLFNSFSKSLKPKSRKEWAPCLAAFLVLCLFMEAVETAGDTFVISQNEISIRNRSKPEYKREFALKLCIEVENMPFKQFAYQFHQIYQTHIRDTSMRAFNPLLTDSFAEQGELDDASLEMVKALRELLEGESYYELDFLVADPILPNQEDHPFPRDVSFNYTGRLLARFLLSFLNEKYLFDGKY